VSKFIRAASWCVQSSPQLQQCSHRSLISACLRAAHDGLLPDGREGALVPYKSDAGDGRTQMVATWIPMIAGIRKKIFQSGEIKAWHCQVVQEGDQFDYELGDHPFVKHKPAARGGRKRPVLWAYSVATFVDGSQSIEVMNIDQIEDVRSKSRARHGPWHDPIFFPEMCRKTVARLHAKQLPTSTDVEAVFRREDESIAQLAAMGEHAPIASPTSTRAALERFAPPADAADEPPQEPEPPPAEPPQAESPPVVPEQNEPVQEPHETRKSGKPSNAAEYQAMYRRTRDSTKGAAGAQMLSKWFYSSEQNELRAICGIDTAELESDLRRHIAELTKSKR
jgi:phage RecT family recombinase